MDEFENVTEVMREVVTLYIESIRRISTLSPLSRNQSHIITLIGRQGPLTLSQITARSDLEKSWISRVVYKMVDDGWLVKRVNPADRRSIILSLTPEGEELYTELTTSIDAYTKELFATIPDVPPEQTMAMLTGLLNALREKRPRAVR